MDTLPLLVVVYLVGLLCAIVIHSAGRAFRGGTIPSPLSALARASVWPLGLLMALAGIVAGMPIILGTRIGQGMRAGLLAHAAAREPARPTKVPVYPFPKPSKSPSVPSNEWPAAASPAQPPSPTDPTSAASSTSATTAAPLSTDTNSASA